MLFDDQAPATPRKDRRKKTTRPVVVADASFERFWQAFPRKTARLDALKAWGALAPTPALVEAMLEALAWQRQQPGWTKDGGAYIPYPASWLRGQRWTDEPFHAPPAMSKQMQALVSGSRAALARRGFSDDPGRVSRVRGVLQQSGDAASRSKS